MRLLVKIILVCVLSLTLTSLPLKSYASDGSTIPVKGNLAKFEDSSSDSSEESSVDRLKKKQTIIREPNYPQTGEKDLNWLSVVGVFLVSVCLYVLYKRK